jgi:hypothetical protein
MGAGRGWKEINSQIQNPSSRENPILKFQGQSEFDYEDENEEDLKKAANRV